MRYFDASALVKRYVRERGSAKVLRLLSSDAPSSSRLSVVEIASALMHRSREGAFEQAECDRALAVLDDEMSALLVAELTPRVVTKACALLRSYSLRAGDAIQLASALCLRKDLGENVEFVAFDDRLVSAARREGLMVI